ncbi:MAG TPA: hypothetical protein VKQ52_12795, partial [Puia sp.]|nr:hypothetical protein [Puia sp.]
MLRILIVGLALICGLVVEGQPVTRLDFYVDQALQNSPLLKDYQNQLQAGQVDSQLIRAGYRPQVTGSSVNLWAPTVN